MIGDRCLRPYCGGSIIEERDMEDTRLTRRVCMLCGREPRIEREDTMPEEATKRPYVRRVSADAEPDEPTASTPLSRALAAYQDAAKSLSQSHDAYTVAVERERQTRERYEAAQARFAEARQELDAQLAGIAPNGAGQHAKPRPHWHRLPSGYKWVGGGEPTCAAPGPVVPGSAMWVGESEAAGVVG